MKMKIICIVASTMLLISFSGCSLKNAEDSNSQTSVSMTEQTTTETNASQIEPDIYQIRSICELATLECYYHNVAKSEKKKGTGITHWFEKDREFWLEYDGVAKVGIEMENISMTFEDNVCTITIPEAKILSMDCSFQKESYISSEDGLNSNQITADDTTNALREAQEEMQETILNNSALLINAQNRAKKLIENYINQLQKKTNTYFKVNWNYTENDSSETTTTNSTIEE